MVKKEGLILAIILIIICLNFVMSEEYVDINWNYNGQWASSGIGDFSGWKTFVDFFINVMLNVRVIELNGHLALSSSDNLGNERIAEDLINFNNETCKLNFGMNLTLPLGIVQRVDYAMRLNGNYNICEIIDYRKYINKTLRDILIDAGSKNITVEFIDKDGNITLIPEKNFSTSNPKFNMTYRHINNGNYPLIPAPVENTGETSLTQVDLFDSGLIQNKSLNISLGQNNPVNNSNNPINNSNINKSVNGTNNRGLEDYKIINPEPKNANIQVFVSERKMFSIENTDYQTIKWFLDGKVVENEENKYYFKKIEIGDYKLKVEISRDSIVKSNLWNIKVVENKKKFPFGMIIFVLIGIFVFLGIIIISYYVFKKNSEK